MVMLKALRRAGWSRNRLMALPNAAQTAMLGNITAIINAKMTPMATKRLPWAGTNKAAIVMAVIHPLGLAGWKSAASTTESGRAVSDFPTAPAPMILHAI